MKFLLLLAVSILSLALPSSAEDITLTTYYPSSSGSYNEISANKIKVGTDLDSISADYVLRFKPAVNNKSCNPGEVYYNGSENVFKICDSLGVWKSLYLDARVPKGTLCGMSVSNGCNISDTCEEKPSDKIKHKGCIRCDGLIPTLACPPGYKKTEFPKDLLKGKAITCVKE